jgi:CheY-like chemotaxis protein
MSSPGTTRPPPGGYGRSPRPAVSFAPFSRQTSSACPPSVGAEIPSGNGLCLPSEKPYSARCLIAKIPGSPRHGGVQFAAPDPDSECSGASFRTGVLMDVQLPGMTGEEASRHLKAEPATATIPVVALAANVMLGEGARAAEVGCAASLTKPLEARLLRGTPPPVPARRCRGVRGTP